MAQNFKLPLGAQLVDNTPSMKLPPGAVLVSDDDKTSPDFTSNPDKQGTYRMLNPNGGFAQVPYGKVLNASNSGWKIDPVGLKRYANDIQDEIRKARMDASKHGRPFTGTNINTKLPQQYYVEQLPPMGAENWIAQKGTSALRGAIDLIPTATGIMGGFIGGGAGGPTIAGVPLAAAAGAAAGGGEGEVWRQYLNEKIFGDRKMGGLESAEKIGAAAAVNAGQEFGGRLLGKILNKPIDALANAAETAERTGIRVMPSEVNGTRASILETYPKASFFTSSQMAKWREAQNEETEKAAKKLADAISKESLSPIGSREEAGNVIRQGIENHLVKFRNMQTNIYNDIESKIANAGGVNVPRADMVNFAQQELDKVNSVHKFVSGRTELDPYRQMLTDIVKNKNNTAPFAAMKDYRSWLLAQTRDDNALLSGTEKGFLKKLSSVVDQSISDSLKKSGIPGIESEWRAANQMTREEHEAFEKKLIENLAAKKNPEQIALVLRGGSDLAASSIGIDEARTAMSVIPKELIPKVQKQILLDTIYEATDKSTEKFNEASFAKKILQIGDERGKVLFGNNWGNVKEFSELLGKIKESGGLQAASLANPEIIKKVGLLPLELVASITGVATHNPEVAKYAAMTFAGEGILWKSIATALTHPRASSTLLKGLRGAIRLTPYAYSGITSVSRGQDILNDERSQKITNSANKVRVDTTDGNTYFFKNQDDANRWKEENPDKVVKPATLGPQSSLDLDQIRKEAIMRSPTRVSVKAPDGQTYHFPDQQSAAAFQAAAGINV